MSSLDAVAWGFFVASIAFIVVAVGSGVQDWHQRRAMSRIGDEVRALRDRVARLEGRLEPRADPHGDR